MNKKEIYSVSLVVSLLLAGSLFVFAQTSDTATVGDVDTTQTGTCLELKSSNLRYRATDAMTGGEVSYLQDFLISTLFLKTQVTGFFGLGTASAVKQFQKSVGLSPTGYVGPLTKAKIKDQSCNGLQSNGGASTSSDGQEINPQNTYNPKSSIGTTSLIKKCSMEARVCLNGKMMARNLVTCEWIPSSCMMPEPLVSLPATSTPPAKMCTMEARLCPDGSMMPRDNNCVWYPKKCPFYDNGGALMPVY